jgi:Phospholipase_D-nuclease N-terminal
MFVLSLGEFLWSLLVVFFMVAYFMILFQVIADVFRRHDASGWKKAGWLAFIFFMPFVGLISYLITNSEDMAERTMQTSRGRYDGYAPPVPDNDPTAELVRAKGLLDSGAITPAEYDRIKARALA